MLTVTRSIDEARETYERLVEVFPTCGRYWKLYIEQEVTGDIHLSLELPFRLFSPQLYYFVLFPLQIRAGKFENVEKSKNTLSYSTEILGEKDVFGSFISNLF